MADNKSDEEIKAQEDINAQDQNTGASNPDATQDQNKGTGIKSTTQGADQNDDLAVETSNQRTGLDTDLHKNSESNIGDEFINAREMGNEKEIDTINRENEEEMKKFQLMNEENLKNFSKDPSPNRTIKNVSIHCKDVVIGINGFEKIGNIDNLELFNEHEKIGVVLNSYDNNDPLTLETIKTKLNLAAATGNMGGSKRSRKAKRTKKGGKKRRNTLRRHRKSR